MNGTEGTTAYPPLTVVTAPTGCCQLLSLVIITLYLLITYTLRNIVHFSDSIGFAKLPILEMIASAELTACACEVASDLAIEGLMPALFFVVVWVALYLWFDSQWLVETCNPCVCVEDLLENRLTERIASLLILSELGGAVIGYRTYRLLRSNFGDDPELISPLKVGVLPGMLTEWLGSLICRLVAILYPKSMDCYNIFLNYGAVIVADLAGTRCTGGSYNPLPITAVYHFKPDLMPVCEFLKVYWVATMIASVTVILIVPCLRRYLECRETLTVTESFTVISVPYIK